MLTAKPETIIDRKQELFRTLVPLIKERIKRDIDPYEEEAVAFVIEESVQKPVLAEAFLLETLGVGEAEVGRDAAMKVHNSVYETKIRKLDRLISENPSDAARLQELKINIDIGHNKTLENYRNPNTRIYIGNVQKDWIPAWMHSPNPPLGQGR